MSQLNQQTARETAFAQHSDLRLMNEQSLVRAVFSQLICFDHELLWKDLSLDAVFLTIAAYGPRGEHDMELLRSGFWFKQIPYRLGPYHNDDTVQYLIALPHAADELEIVWQRLKL